MSVANKLLQAAAGNAAASGDVFVDDVFSTDLWTGNGGTQSIVNGIDLSGEGGLTWIKYRDQSLSHHLTDTERGTNSQLSSDSTGAAGASTVRVTGFNNNGFTLGANTGVNGSTGTYVGWTFRKQEKFFDIVTYTGDGTSGKTVSHNLGSVPGMIIVKRLDGADDWNVFHRKADATAPEDKYLQLNKYDAVADSISKWNDTAPTATEFTLGNNGHVNANGGTFVAYLFAHAPNSNFLEDSTEYYASNSNISGFNGTGEYRIYVNGNLGNTYYNAGTASGSVSGAPAFAEIEAAIETATGQKVRTGPQQLISGAITFYSIVTIGPDSSPFDDEESFITCGSYEGNGSTNGPVVNLGFEPQWLLIKNADNGQDGMHWYIFDNMRGMASGGENVRLKANKTDVDAGVGSSSIFDVSATGFQLNTASGSYNRNGDTFIYMAIRRPNKPASEFAATDLFALQAKSAGEGADTFISTGFNVDTVIYRKRSASATVLGDRLRGQSGGGDLITNDTNTEGTNAGAFFLDHSNGVTVDYAGGHFNVAPAATDTSYIRYFLRRAEGFFDTVTYTSNTTYPNTFNHNLGVVPELILIKRRDGSSAWAVYSSATGNAKHLVLNTANAESASSYWNSTTPTSTVVTVGGQDETWGYNGYDYVAYLFATVDGISKVGSYTGTGSDLNVDCGFTAGARFVLIKRTDGAGQWYLWDSARGIVAGNDPYVFLSTTSAEKTTDDYIDPLNAGFTVTSSAPAALNTNGGTYIFLAIA